MQLQMSHSQPLECFTSELGYLLYLVETDLLRKRQVYDRATIPQRQIELRAEIREIEGLRERLERSAA